MAKKNKWWDSFVKGTKRTLTPTMEDVIVKSMQDKSQENANSQNYGNLLADTWNSIKAGASNLYNSTIGAYQKTNQDMKAEQRPTNETIATSTPSITMNEKSIRNLYPSLYAPDLANGQTDNMQGWRGTMSAINNKYGGDILGYANTDAFKSLSSDDKAQYYQDVGYFNNLYNTVNSYDTGIANEQRKAREAQEYADTRQRLMQKYMPETLAAMGYANTGLAADAMMGINNRYENYALSAKQQSEANQNALLDQYRKAVNDYTTQRSEQELADIQTQEGVKNNYLNNIYTSVADFNPSTLDAALNTGEISQPEYDEMMGVYSNELVKYLNNSIIASPESFDKNSITQAVKLGYISQKQGDKLMETYNKENPTSKYASGQSVKFVDDMGKDMSGVVTLVNGGWGKFIENASEGLSPDELWANKDIVLKEHSGKSGKKRDNPLYDAIEKAKNEQLQEGQVIDINYGENDDKRSDMVSYVVYINGKFYPVTYSGTEGTKFKMRWDPITRTYVPIYE